MLPILNRRSDQKNSIFCVFTRPNAHQQTQLALLKQNTAKNKQDVSYIEELQKLLFSSTTAKNIRNFCLLQIPISLAQSIVNSVADSPPLTIVNWAMIASGALAVTCCR